MPAVNVFLLSFVTKNATSGTFLFCEDLNLVGLNFLFFCLVRRIVITGFYFVVLEHLFYETGLLNLIKYFSYVYEEKLQFDFNPEYQGQIFMTDRSVSLLNKFMKP